MLLIPSGQDPLALGIQSKQVGARKQIGRDFQRWRERGKIKGVDGGTGIRSQKQGKMGKNGARNEVKEKKGTVKRGGLK